MNIIDIIHPNPFLHSLFPQGLAEDVLIGNIEFDSGGHSWITIHTNQQNHSSVKKWGVYGKDYNTIAIKLSICNLTKFSLSGWFSANYFPVEITKGNDNKYIFRQKSKDFYIEIEAEYFSFHSCSTYLNSEN
ncbi:hypothetical protein GV764_15350 [Atlantibacter hermannii]|nr:hypothetical protein [Atlantibacter hermannii]NBD00389.1 hypothetical protein [Atlantibacter hermannii]